MIFVLGVQDFGEYMNKKLGRICYEQGDIMQAHILILGCHVWIERDRSVELWRVAFGDRPEFPDQVNFNQAKKLIENYFAGLVMVTS